MPDNDRGLHAESQLPDDVEGPDEPEGLAWVTAFENAQSSFDDEPELLGFATGEDYDGPPLGPPDAAADEVQVEQKQPE